MPTGQTSELPFTAEREILTVSALNRAARLLIEEGFGKVWVEGEISNLSRPASGHMYWSLKDARAQVRCAMFRQTNRRLEHRIENGQQVLLSGRVSLYEARGDFQIIVDYVEEAGEGLLRRKFEALKKKLADEGLFDDARKQALPPLPTRIGVITSPTGAAVRDVLIALKRRFPATQVLIYPTSVQGEGAAEEICAALRRADERRDCDLLILTRGGGSLEDLWAFNEEIVARAIAELRLPIIVGVGHEVDFTIADFVADLRAPTPSQAAELAVPDAHELVVRFERFMAQLGSATTRLRADRQNRFDALAHRLQRAHPGIGIRARQQRLDELEGRLGHALRALLADRQLRLGRVSARIAAASPRRQLALAAERARRASDALRRAIETKIQRIAQRTALAARALGSLSPLATLQRGYAIVSRRDDGRIVTDSATIDTGTGIHVRLARGALIATVDRSAPDDDGP